MAIIDTTPVDPTAPPKKKAVSYKNLALGAGKYSYSTLSVALRNRGWGVSSVGWQDELADDQRVHPVKIWA